MLVGVATVRYIIGAGTLASMPFDEMVVAVGSSIRLRLDSLAP